MQGVKAIVATMFSIVALILNQKAASERREKDSRVLERSQKEERESWGIRSLLVGLARSSGSLAVRSLSDILVKVLWERKAWIKSRVDWRRSDGFPMITSAPNRVFLAISSAPASRGVGGCDNGPGKALTSWRNCHSAGNLTARPLRLIHRGVLAFPN